MRLKKIIMVALLTAALSLFGFSSVHSEDLAPCPPTDIEVDLSSLYGPGNWVRMEKGVISDYYGGTMAGLAIWFDGYKYEFDPGSCPYSKGYFYKVLVPIGVFDSPNPLWRKIDPVE